MKKTPQVLWAEGMFLRPHHLQTAERYREEALQREIQRIQPFYFGLQSLDVAPDQLENFVFEIRDVSLKLKDGTALSSDSTLRISPRSFKNELDKASGRMRVFVGVPVMRETAPNTFAPGEGPAGVDRRYVAENAEALDENTGGNPQPVGVRRCNGKLFFGAESQEGYECLISSRLPLRSCYLARRPQAIPRAEEVLALAEEAWDRQVSELGFWPPRSGTAAKPYAGMDFYVGDAYSYGASGYTSPFDVDTTTPQHDCLAYIVIE